MGAVLITGATGFVGIEVLARYLERTNRRVYAVVRAPDEETADERLRSALSTFFGRADAHAGRARAVPGDIEQEDLGLTPDVRRRLAREVGDIVHAAASVSFSLPLDESRAINVEGTRRMLELAELCRDHGGLRRFCAKNMTGQNPAFPHVPHHGRPHPCHTVKKTTAIDAVFT